MEAKVVMISISIKLGSVFIYFFQTIIYSSVVVYSGFLSLLEGLLVYFEFVTKLIFSSDFVINFH